MNMIAVITVALPILAVLTNMLTNVLKGICPLFAANAKLVSAVCAMLLTLGTAQGYLDQASAPVVWYWYAGAVVLGGVVAYVAMNGYDGMYEDLIRRLKGGSK